MVDLLPAVIVLPTILTILLLISLAYQSSGLGLRLILLALGPGWQIEVKICGEKLNALRFPRSAMLDTLHFILLGESRTFQYRKRIGV